MVQNFYNYYYTGSRTFSFHPVENGFADSALNQPIEFHEEFPLLIFTRFHVKIRLITPDSGLIQARSFFADLRLTKIYPKSAYVVLFFMSYTFSIR